MCQSFCVSAVPTWRTDDEFCVLLFSSRVLFRYYCPPSGLCAVPFWYGHLLRHIYTQCPISGCCLFFFFFFFWGGGRGGGFFWGRGVLLMSLYVIAVKCCTLWLAVSLRSCHCVITIQFGVTAVDCFSSLLSL